VGARRRDDPVVPLLSVGARRRPLALAAVLAVAVAAACATASSTTTTGTSVAGAAAGAAAGSAAGAAAGSGTGASAVAPAGSAAGAAAGSSAGAAAASPPPGAPAAATSVSYTQAQAQRGEQVFGTICAACHATVEFRGQLFRQTWMTRPIGDFYQHIRTAMPQDQPGSLTPEQYLAVVAYVLRLNGHPAGERELPSDTGVLGALAWPR
jgi:mono/diheme cytochrome c family protein